MKTKAAERRPTTTNANLVQMRPGSQPFFQKETDNKNSASTETSFFHAPVQAKLTIGKPNDKYEKEADGMAERVVNGHGSTGMSSAPSASPAVQNKCATCENQGDKKEEEKVQAKALYPQISPLIQRQAESEEEEVQAKMQKEEEEPLQRQAEEEEEEVQAKMGKEEEEEPLQRKEEEEEEVQAKMQKEEEEPLQRQAEEEEEEVQAKMGKEEEEPVQRRSSRPVQPQPNEGFASRLRSRLGRGAALQEDVRSEMEAGFGADFSSVQVHTDRPSVEMSQEIGAQAFTRGNDIFFNNGRFNTGTSTGMLLLAHELTHTIQQGAVGPINIETNEGQGMETNQSAPSSDQSVAPEASETTTEAPDQANPTAEAQQAPPAGAAAEGEAASGDEIEKAPNSAEEDPQFQEQLKFVEKKGGKQREHQPESVEAVNTKRAAKAPPNEVESYSKGRHVGQLQEEGNKVEPFNAESFKAELKKRIEAIAPKSLGAMENFKKDGGVDRVKNEVKQNVKDEKSNTIGPLEKKNEQPPDQAGIEAKDTAPMPDRPQPPSRGQLDTTAATPKPKTSGEWEQPAQAQVAKFNEDDLENEVDDEQLQEGNEPSFNQYLGEKQNAKTAITENMQTYRTEEQATLDTQRVSTGEEGKKGLGGFASFREKSLESLDEKQGATITKDELARNKVSSDLDGIFNDTKTEVERLLSTMETGVNTYFDTEAKNAQTRFIDYVETELDAYKDRRYSGLRGKYRKLRDWWKGLPSEANQFYVTGKEQYVREMDLVIDHVANLVVTGLNDAQKEIVKGRGKVDEYLSTLEGDLAKYGEEIAEGISSKFDSLEGTIASKQEQMIGDLAKKYTDNLQQVNDQIEKWKEANKGMADKIKDLALGIWRTIKSLAKMLWSIVERIGNVVGSIIKAPVRFFKNLVAGVKQGFDQFKKNIEKHLKAALFNWLFGTMTKAGIQLPQNFDLKGVFSLILQVLGLGMAAIRARAVKILGEPIVQKLEKVGEVFKILMTDGPGALIQHAMDKVTEMKEKIVDEIKEMVSTEIITAGITFVLGMLTPVGAFIKACKGIYNLIKFFIQRAKDIVALIDAILNSIEAMIAGKVQVAADKVEDALAKFLPLGIGFLASLVGISGMADKVRKIVDRVRTKIQEKIIDPVIQKAYSIAQKAGKFIGDSKIGKMAKSGTAFVKKKAVEAKEKVQAGVAKVKGKIVDWWTARKKFKASDGSAHTLYFDGKPENAKLMVRSTPQTYEDFINRININDKDPDKAEKINAKSKAIGIATQIDDIIADAAIRRENNPDASIQQNVQQLLNQLAGLTEKLMEANQEVPPSIIEYGSLTNEGGGTYADAKILSKNHVEGSTPQDSPPIWKKANRREKSSVFVRGHLLNHNIGGPGYAYNLTPITGNRSDFGGSGNANKMHLDSVEKFVKSYIDSNKVVRYKVKAMYQKHADREYQKILRNRVNTPQEKPDDRNRLEIMDYEQDNLPVALLTNWATLKKENGKWVDDEVQTPIHIMTPLPYESEFKIKNGKE